MASRDEAVRAFGGHDAGEARGAQHVAFHRIALEDDIERFFTHQHAPFGNRDALRDSLFGDVDHAGFAALVDVGEGRWRQRGLGWPWRRSWLVSLVSRLG